MKKEWGELVTGVLVLLTVVGAVAVVAGADIQGPLVVFALVGCVAAALIKVYGR